MAELAPPAAAEPVLDDGTIDVDGTRRSLRASVVSGLAWNSLLTVVIQGARILSSLVLVRLLEPRDYGLAGMALIFSSLVLNFADLGFGSALVQRPRITEADRSTAFWTTAGVGLLLMAVGIGVSGPIAGFFHEPRVQILFIAISATFFVGSLGATQASLIHRAMNFRAITIRLVIATVAGCLVAIGVAAAGGGPWALVSQQLTVTVLSTVSLWLLCDWRPRLVFSRESFRDFAGFGGNVVGANFLDYLQSNMDNLLIGRYVGSAALGTYSVAYNVILIPMGRLFVPVQETLFPALARIQGEPERLGRLWARAVQGIVTVIAPAMLGLIVVAPDFVDVVLGTRWHAAAPVMRILAVVTLAYAVTSIAYRTLLAVGRPDIALRFSAANAVLAVGAFVVGLHWGIVGVAAAYTIVTVPLQALLVVLVTRVIGMPLGRFARGLAPVTQVAAVMTAACWLTREGLIQLGLSEAPRLVVVVLVGLLVYLPLAAWRSPELVAEIRNIRSRRRVQDGPSPA